MTWQDTHVIARRNALLATAVILMLIAVLLRPAALLCFASLREFINTAIMVVAALYSATGMTDYGDLWLRGPGSPWYVRRGTLIVLLLWLLLATTLAVVIGNLVFRVIGSGHLMSDKGAVLEFLAFQVLWVVVLQWPHYEDPSRPRTGTSRGERHPRRPTAYLR